MGANKQISLTLIFTLKQVLQIEAIRIFPDGEICNDVDIEDFSDLCALGIVRFEYDRDNCKEYYLTTLGQRIRDELLESNLLTN